MKMPASMYPDQVWLIKKDGTRSGPARASVANNKIVTQDTSLDIEDGDILARTMPGGREEHWHVIECGYQPETRNPMNAVIIMDAFFDASVRKSTAPSATPSVVSNTFHTAIHGGSTIQIGTHNQMEVKNAIETIAQIIDNSTATPEQKAEAKGALKQFLEHPMVVGIVGALASGAVAANTK